MLRAACAPGARSADAVWKDHMSKETTPSPKAKCAGDAVGIGAVALGIVSAPTAAASPAPSSVEADYIGLLDANGMHIHGQDANELKLGYLLCALSQRNGIPPAGSAGRT